MAVTTFKSFSMPAASQVIEVLRGFLNKSDPDAPITQDQPEPVATKQVLSVDQERYARLLDHELDRRLLTEVEREDSEMLARVRSALYADD